MAAPKKISDAHRARIIDVYLQRRAIPSDKQLAREIGVSVHAIREWIRFANLDESGMVKQRARNIASNEKRAGRLQMQPCEVCGSSPADKHHPDYTKPLEVVWLCEKHHYEHHTKNGYQNLQF